MTSESDKLSKNPTHTAEDHMFGSMMGHRHMPWEEADHDHDRDFDLLEAGSKDLEHVPLTSIGIDIGSSGTQVIFSKLLMRGPGEPVAMRRIAKSREILHMSPVVLTPFDSDNRIDLDRLRGSLAKSYRDAGLTPDEIDTGVVILTGAAARRDNAAAIIDALSAECGDIVAAVAGDHMEAMLAAFGSGAAKYSAENFSRILNVDIGGASIKFALIDCGKVIATAAMHGGGRQIVLDRQNSITRIELELQDFAKRLGVDCQIGGSVSHSDLESVADALAAEILAIIAGRPKDEIKVQFITQSLPEVGTLDGVQFSGGVSEYIYGREKRDFGDLGLLLGNALARGIADGSLPCPLVPAGDCIRATALGASQYSVQMGGATSCITAPGKLLPRRNLQVLQSPFDFSGAIDARLLAESIKKHRRQFDDTDPWREVALAFRWRGSPEHGRVKAFAEGIAAGLDDKITAGTNLYILMEGDAALTLGGILRQELTVQSEVLAIDGIVLRDFDYVDIGRIRLPSGMVPVTVKSLLFGQPSR